MGEIYTRQPIIRKIAGIGNFLIRDLKKHRYIYIMAIPVLVYYIVFYYFPMYGAQIAFKAFNPGKGILGSPWIGLRNFRDFFGSVYFIRVLRNTMLISLYGLLFSFPAPIILALLLNELRSMLFKRVVQTISYLPHFISLMVVCGMILDFTAKNGLINDIIEIFGGKRVSFLLYPQYFRFIYVSSDIWQTIGWGSIIYLAALTSIDPAIYEAATIDGANRWKKMLHITLPGLTPTIVILLILRIGQMMNVGFEKTILLYNTNIYETADVISSFVYRRGLLEFNYSYSAAVGFFNSVVNFSLMLFANWASRKVTENSLW